MGSNDEQGALYRGMYPDAGAMTPERLEYLRNSVKSNKIKSLRTDGTTKGYGWLGNIAGTGKNAGMDMTEYSIGVKLGEKEYTIPSIVPTLTKDEIAHISAGKGITRQIMLKAVEHAKARMAEGKSVWADTPDYGTHNFEIQY